jgi:protein-S-isoprenylcysteine O-methyltransferase Ste14
MDLKRLVITGGPYAVVKHALYTAVSLLVLYCVGFLLNTWLGAAIGVALYVGSRIFAPAEEASLSTEFGPRWEALPPVGVGSVALAG